MDKLRNYQVPPHVLRRTILAFVLSQALVLVACRPLYAVLSWLPAFVIQVTLGMYTAWRAGKWAFRSPLTFREAIVAIRTEYEEQP